MQDLTIILEDNVKLNVRTTGVFTKDNKVLVHKCKRGDHYALPGGRVTADEEAIEALDREIKEEIGEEIENEKLIGIVENFFNFSENKYHEYMWMIKADFKDKSTYLKDVINGIEEKGINYEWVDIDDLDKINFKPAGVIPYIKNMGNEVNHIILRENNK